MDLEELRAFLAVVERGSFLAAAVQTHSSRATLRRRVDALEARAGRPLLERNPQGVTLTAAGQLLAEQGRLIMQDVDALVDALRDVSRAPAGRVTIMLPVGMPPQLTPQLVRLLRSQCPDVQIDLRAHADPASAALDDVDLVIYVGERDPPGPWVCHELLVARERLLASPEYLAARGAPRSLEQLAEHELFVWRAPDRDAPVAPLRAGGSVPITPTLVSPDIFQLRELARAGLGITLAPDAELDDSEGFIPVLPELVERALPVRVAVRGVVAELSKNRAVLARFRELVDALDRGDG
ncbi:MAG: LysR family transcriptional regulator [Myxococcales bacterium]|nr:LysR family transcriptional regulator [Myxococcales bacterium]